MHLDVLSLFMCVYHMCPQYTLTPEEGIGSLGTRLTGGCEPPYGCWELNPGLLQEQQALLIAETFLQLLIQYNTTTDHSF